MTRAPDRIVLPLLASALAAAVVAASASFADEPGPRPDLAALPLEPEAALAERLVKRAGLEPVRDDVFHRIEASERDEPDPYRLKTVSWLRSNPLRVPGA